MTFPVFLLLALTSAAAPAASSGTDAFAWLEDGDSQRTQRWTAQQDKAARAALNARPGRAGLRRELAAVAAEAGSFQDLAVRGARIFTLQRASGSQSPVLFVRTSRKAPPLPVLDEASLSSDGAATLAWWDVSQDGLLLAYGAALPETGGVELRLREVGSTMDLPDRISRVPEGPVAWLPDRTGFYYARLPGAAAAPQEAARGHIFFHVLGTDPSRDSLVLSTGTSADRLDLQVSADGGVLVLTLRHPSGRGDLLVQDRRRPDAGFIALAVDSMAARPMILEGRTLTLLSEPAAAPNQLLVFDLRRPRQPRRRPLMLPGPLVAKDIVLLRGGLAARVEENGVSRLQLHDRAGRPLREIPTPGSGGVSALAADPAHDNVLYVWQSLLTPPALCRYDARASSFTILDSSPGPDPEEFRLRRAQFKTTDGTPLTLILASNRLLKRDSENPAILADLPRAGPAGAPAFSPMLLAWLKAGGLWAAPEPMPRQGAADLLAAAGRWLAEQEYTRPGRIAILGRGPDTDAAAAAASLAPGLFAAAVLEQPAQDLAPRSSFPPALIIAGPCPFGAAPAHARKFAAALEQAGGTTLLRWEQSGCAELPPAEMIEQDTDIQAFLLWRMGLEKAEPPPKSSQAKVLKKP